LRHSKPKRSKSGNIQIFIKELLLFIAVSLQRVNKPAPKLKKEELLDQFLALAEPPNLRVFGQIIEPSPNV
jgi:hypothetical protein